MRAIAVQHYKKPLEVVDLPEPEAGPGEVLVSVAAAGMNPLDEGIRLGAFRQILPYRAPFVLGHDVAGTVIGVGGAVSEFAVGDAVYGRLRDGAIGSFAERVVANPADLARAPRSVSVEEAAAIPLVALTAWQALVEIANVQPGQRVLIHAGAGGLGSTVIQLAKHLGAHVATTVSARNADFARELGADVIIDYNAQDFVEELSGYDVVLDSVGGENLTRSLRVLRPGGVAIGVAGPPTPAFAKAAGLGKGLQLAMGALSGKVRRRAKRLGVTYQFLFMRASGAQLSEITALVDQGVIRPVVSDIVEFDEIPAALTRLAAGGGRGKVVARIAGRSS